jgi:sortase B
MMRTRNKPALIFFCLLLSAAAVLAGVNIYSELKERQKEKEDFAAVAEIAELPMTEAPAESVTDAETEPSAEPTEQPAAERNIQALIAENADCVGWLSIDGTSISYPVMYTPSELQKYLRRSFYGQYSQSGVPFLDGRCDLQNSNLIIYGHNMRNGTMFSDLKRYVDRDFLNAHRTVKFETADGVQTFIVTEVLKTNTSDAWYDRIAAEDGRQLILSTCYGSGKDGRLLIIAAES